MPKFMPTGTHGARHTQWQRKVMHMKHVIGKMCEQNFGQIVNISSVNALAGQCDSSLHKRGSQAL